MEDPIIPCQSIDVGRIYMGSDLVRETGLRYLVFVEISNDGARIIQEQIMDKETSKRLAKMAGKVLSKGPHSLTMQEALETLSSFAGCVLAQYEKDKLESVTPATTIETEKKKTK